MSLEVTDVPAPSRGVAAPPLARVLAQARWETVLVLRNGEQLLLTLVLPALALVGLSQTSLLSVAVPDGHSAVDAATASVLAMAVISTAFTGQAIATGFDRRHGVLRLMGTTPLGRGGLLTGRLLAILAVEAVQVLVLGAVAAALGWRPDAVGLVLALPLVLTGTAAFTALGLLLAGTMRAEAVLALANLVWVVLVLAGGVLVPPDDLPGAVGTLARALPSGALAEGLREALLYGRLDGAYLATVAAWAAAASAAAVRWFRWD